MRYIHAQINPCNDISMCQRGLFKLKTILNVHAGELTAFHIIRMAGRCQSLLILSKNVQPHPVLDFWEKKYIS
jgi:hypothetical protein